MKFILTALLALFAQQAIAQTGTFQTQQNDFKTLFNMHRFAQPQIVPWAGSFFPYSQDGTAIKLGRSGMMEHNGRSPLEVYDRLAKQSGGRSSEAWERENHTCRHLTGETKRSCEGWWGHCNGWAAAAIKESEPRSDLRVNGESLSVAEQKAIYTELWLSSGSLFVGESDKGRKVGDWVHAHGSNTDEYRRFWDVTPRAFFLVFTNYVGLLRTGVIIDRHTGDEVWNQPITGYRILPLRPSDIREVTDRGVTYWSVFFRMKIYWANDLGTPPGHLSTVFDIARMTNDSERVEHFPNSIGGRDYEGRLLQFRLMLDAPVTISRDGTQILSAGRIIGDGIWEHQENSRKYNHQQLSHSHPDFIWLPTNPILDNNGYGNPYVTAANVALIRSGNSPAALSQNKPSIAGSVTTMKLLLSPKGIHPNDLTPARIKGRIKGLLAREGVQTEIRANDIQMGRDRIVVPLTFATGVNSNALNELFRSANYTVSFEM